MTQSPTAPYGNQPHGEAKNNGLGVAALIVGIIAFIIAWIPCINFLAILLALVAIGLGIAGWIAASGKPDQKATFSIIGLILGVVAVIAFFISYAILGSMAEGGFRGIMERGEITTQFSQDAQAIADEARARGVSNEIVNREFQEFSEELGRLTGESFSGSVEEFREQAQTELDELQADLEAAPAEETPALEDPAATDESMPTTPGE